MNKVAIIGSRSFKNYEYMKESLGCFAIGKIISGGARGADSLARKFAEENGIEITEILPRWDIHGKSAGFIRNEFIIEGADIVVAFWDGKSRGTAHSISLAREAGKDVYIFWKE
jgi:predicted Rossmann fold nucleotide-binding protein DprA/Smf involved in DNA uptake